MDTIMKSRFLLDVLRITHGILPEVWQVDDVRIRLGGVWSMTWQGSCIHMALSNAQMCEVKMTHAGACLQSDIFGWVGLDCLTDRRGCWSKQKMVVGSTTT